MPNPENMIPHRWKPGQSGNPKGRPRREITMAMMHTLDQSTLSADEIADLILEMALGKRGQDGKWIRLPNLGWMQLLYNRLEAKPIRFIEFSKDIKPLAFDNFREPVEEEG